MNLIYVVKMVSKRYKKIYIILLIVFLALPLIESTTISKYEFKNFLREELKNYFEGQNSILEKEEMRQGLNFYFSLNENDLEINLLTNEISPKIEDFFKQDSAPINSNQVENFNCDIELTATESWETESIAQEDGWEITCCNGCIPIMLAPCGCAGKQKICVGEKPQNKNAADEKCEEILGHNYYMKRIGLYSSYESTMKKNKGKCQIENNVRQTNSETREVNKIISETISTKDNLKRVSNLYLDMSENQGQISNFTAKLNCDNSNVNVFIDRGILFAQVI